MSEHSPSPLVSIVIPAYNAEQYVAQTIESVIRQTYQQLEVIVVDDGSTDATPGIVRNYAEKDPRITIVTQSNAGLSAARNAGLKVAKGEYLCIIDADDIMLPEKIASQLACLEQHSEADFTYSKVFYFNDGNKQLRMHDLATPEGSEVYRALLRHGNLISPNAVFFRKKVFDTIGGFDEQLRSAEDLDYWLLLSSKGVYFVHQPQRLTLCRMRTNSLTADSVTLYRSAVTVFEKHLHGTWARYTSMQYLKNRLLLSIAYARKPRENNEGKQSNTSSHHGVSQYINTLYHWIRNIKFSLKFRKTYNKEVHDYLLMIESHKGI